MECTYFDELITIQEQSISAYHKWVKRLVRAGVVTVLLAGVTYVATYAIALLAPDRAAMFTPNIGLITAAMGALGTLVGASATVFYGQIPPRRIKVSNYRVLKQRCEAVRNWPERKRLKELKELKEFLEGL